MSATPLASGPPSLLRAVSRWQIVAVSINDVIGSGVYLLPARAAALLGAASMSAVPVAGLCVLLIVLCFAEAGSKFDRAGGAYVYTREAFGDFIGFEVGWMTWVTRVTVAATLSAAFADAFGEWWAGAASGWGRALAVVLSLLFLTGINIAGVKHGARAAVVLVVGKVLPLLVLIAIGIFAVDWSRIDLMARPPLAGLPKAALLLLFAYAGFENTAAPAGEYRNAQRDVPFALFVMIAAVTVIYSLAQLVALGLVPDLAHSPRPLAAAARVLLGPFGASLLTVGGLLSILGTNNNTTLAGARYLYALADSGRIPRFFGSVHPRFRTPWIAILTQTAIALPLALTGSFVELAELSVIARMAAYIGTAASVPFLRRKLPDTPRTIRLPGGPAIPIATLAVCAFLLRSAKGSNLVAGAAALAVGAVIYHAAGRRRAG
ncbi:MAG TPA: APC family permease [Candidatus Acidoferrum sp.]|nr:APC family permease [Candidatus Acidoferrum sp.]